MKLFKKPFKESKAGKFLTKPAVKGLISLIPFNVGSAAKEFLDKTDTPEGQMSREKAMLHFWKLVLYAVLLYLVISGKISFDQAQDYKEFVQ